MDTIHKEGFLQKAGKRSFQAWRKRWFVLNEDCLKYYNPGSEYNETNLLGVIQMFEIQTVSPSKQTKHAFDIMTRNRTFNVSAKSDIERDDWIIELRKASNSKRNATISGVLYRERGLPVKRLDSKSSVVDGTSPDPFETGKAMKALKKESKKMKSFVPSLKKKDKQKQTEMIIESPTITKPRAATFNVEPRDKEIVLKQRAQSQDDCFAIRANSMLRKMSTEAEDEEEEKKQNAIYDEAGEKLRTIPDDEIINESDDEDDDDESEDDLDINQLDFSLPKPREGETYAFEELKVLLKADLSGLQQCNLETIKNAYSYSINETEEYPAMAMLKLHLGRMK